VNATALRPLAAAVTLILMTAGSTAISSLFVAYRAQWGISSADIAIVFSAYVGTLLPVLLLFGGLADRFGRRPVAVAGILSMAAGLLVLALAHGLVWLIVARLFQGTGVGLSIGALTAALAESYRGRLPTGNALQSVAAVGLFTGPVLSAVAFNLGGGVNLSYLPSLALVIALPALTPWLAERAARAGASAPLETPYPPATVGRALRYALPLAFVSWAGLSLYLSLVPAYLAASLHAANPAIGAAAVVASQLASLVATIRLGNVAPERSGVIGAATAIAGLALLVMGTNANLWPLIVVATLLVGAGSGVGSAAAFGLAGRIGRGQRARVFARLYVAAYAGYSVPALAIGIIAAHASFTVAFVTVIAALAAIAAALPLLRERPAATATVRCPAAAAA
jgi:MFS family permease